MMIWDIQKFNREIKCLYELPAKMRALHPLRREQIKQAVLAQIAGKTPIGAAARHFALPDKFIRYFIPILVSLGLVGGTALASQGSMPGDALYPVKRAQEQIEVNMAFTPSAKAKAHSRHAEERLEELARLKIKSGIPASVSAKSATTTAGGLASSASATLPAASNETPLQVKIREKAVTDARTQVHQAIGALTNVKAELEAKGDVGAAAEIKQNILRLREKARKQEIEVEDEIESKRENRIQEKAEKPEAGSDGGREIIKPEDRGEAQVKGEVKGAETK